MKLLARLIATSGFVGHVPIAPGTFGSAVGVLLFVLERNAGVSVPLELGAIAILFVLGIWSAGVVERDLGVDPGPVVVDEVVGMLITMALLPLSATGIFVAFLVFRVLDVIKPWPAGRFERLHGGLGVMADDVMAGVYGNLLMIGLTYIAPSLLQ